jgi:hypothetical protein
MTITEKKRAASIVVYTMVALNGPILFGNGQGRRIRFLSAPDPADRFPPYVGSAFEVTVTFAEQAEKTKITSRMLFDSAAECDKVKSFAVERNDRNF